ncbi:hypothetical protein C2845_PM06G20480 [Panicum miliaceum]|uniref:Uncharacterized protein n=1 Tax=Panicum miliaceum TaxID=4540 RepID=A0A3L6R4M4_PANMI|nr:hypothetical protein C2845_PM06G20480 [Panicum miliaceum]
MSHPLHPSSARSDMDEIETLARAAPPQAAAVAVPPAALRPASPPRASIPVSSSALAALPPVRLPFSAAVPGSIVSAPVVSGSIAAPGSVAVPISSDGFGGPEPASHTLTEPVWDTVKRDLHRVVSNLMLVVFPNPFREDPGKALRDWDLWGPFFFIVSLGLILSWSATAGKLNGNVKEELGYQRENVS